MNNTVENDFFGLLKVKWLHLTGEADRSVRFSCPIFSGFNMPKNHENRLILTELLKNNKCAISWTRCINNVCIKDFHFVCNFSR